MKMLLVAIFALSCAQISNAVTPPGYKWFPSEYTTPPYPTAGEFTPKVYGACDDSSINTPGVYLIQPNSDIQHFEVYCHIKEGKTWTVIQQRFNKSVDFYRNYANYTKGFGPIGGNHWLGLEKIHQITKDGDHELLVELQAYNLTRAYAKYSTFKVDSKEAGFQLTIAGYSGNAGDSMTRSGNWNLNGMKFTTFDKDQDMWWKGNCAVRSEGGWWYKNCANSDVNSPYHDWPVRREKTMHWFYDFDDYTLKSVRFMVRRK